MLDSVGFSVKTWYKRGTFEMVSALSHWIIFVVANVVVLSSETRPYSLNRVTGEIVAAKVYNFSEGLLLGL